MGAVVALPPLFASTPDTEEGRAADLLYRATRDHVTKIPVCDALTKAWHMYGHLMPEKPEQFVREFRRDFHARSWELYVLRWLARTGAKLIRAPVSPPVSVGTKTTDVTGDQGPTRWRRRGSSP
jgi:hypothetical protein